MKIEDDLRNVRNDIYRAYSQDGLWDILFGWFLFSWQIGLQNQATSPRWFPGPSVAAVFLLVWLLRRWITYPRLGRARLQKSARRWRFWTVFVVVLVLNELFSLLYTGIFGRFAQGYLLLAFGIMAASIMSLIAVWWKVGRFWIWAGMAFAAFAIYQWFHTPASFSFVVPGGIIAIYGVILLYGFIRRYPNQGREESNGE